MTSRYDLCTPDMHVGWRVCETDFTSHNGYRWPYPGTWAEPHNPSGREMTTHDDCPTFEGDGLCIANNCAGAASGGIRLSTVLVVGFCDADVLVRGENKTRVRRALVLDVWDGQRIVRGALTSADLTSANLTYANLRYANLTYANLTYANLRYARYDEFTGLPTGFDPIARGMVKS